MRRGLLNLLPVMASCLLVLPGCAGYKLGPSNGLSAQTHSVEVKPFLNHTTEPRLTSAVTASLRKKLQQDGTFRLETGSEGDIVLSGVIIEYERTEVSLDPDDVLTPRDYQITLRAHIQAVERSSGRMLVDRDVFGRTTVRVGADLVSAERQAIPLMAEDLARRATSFLVDGAW